MNLPNFMISDTYDNLHRATKDGVMSRIVYLLTMVLPLC